MSTGRIDAATQLPVLTKQPTSSKLFRMDFTAPLTEAPIGSVTSVVAANQNRVGGSTAVTVSEITFEPYVVAFRLAGGTDGEAYKVTAIVVDTDGNTVEDDGMLLVEDR